ncbi:MAG: pyrimidine dimer DNA glycosylase/endonuclease V [Nitrososphaerales archaeon]
MVDPRIMCRQHLLGEHAEIHMFIGTLSRKNSVKGYLEKGLLEVHSLYDRHEELVKEMKHRGYRHCSKISEKWKHAGILGYIDKDRNLEQLIGRCSRCGERYERVFTKV